jgi:hypothetical protein
VSRGTARAAPAVSLCTVITPWLVQNSNIYWHHLLGIAKFVPFCAGPIHGDLADIVNSQ